MPPPPHMHGTLAPTTRWCACLTSPSPPISTGHLHRLQDGVHVIPPPSSIQDTYTDYKMVCMPDLSPLLPEDEARTTFLTLANQEYNASILCPASLPGSRKMCVLGEGGGTGKGGVLWPPSMRCSRSSVWEVGGRLRIRLQPEPMHVCRGGGVRIMLQPEP